MPSSIRAQSWKDNAHGAVAVLILLLLATMALLFSGLIGRILITYRLHHEVKTAAEETEQLWSSYAAAIATTPPQRRYCIAGSAPHRKLCLWQTPLSYTTKPPPILSPQYGFSAESLPLWSFDSFTALTRLCVEQVPLPPSLSSDSLTSLRTCASESTLNGVQRIDGNFFPAAGTVYIHATTIVVLGSVAIHTAQIRPPLALVAAGDIIIESLEVLSDQSAGPISLISARGRVTVPSYHGPASLSAVSPVEVQVPTTALARQLSLPEELIRGRIIEGSANY